MWGSLSVLSATSYARMGREPMNALLVAGRLPFTRYRQAVIPEIARTDLELLRETKIFPQTPDEAVDIEIRPA